MIVSHVVRQFHPAIGGLEDAVAGLVRAQRRAGVDARVVTLDRTFTEPATRLAADATIDGVPVRRLPWRGSSRYPIAPTVLGAIAGADLVHVHAIDFFFDFLALSRPVHGRKLVATTHGGFFHTGRNARLKVAWFNSCTRLAVRAYDALVACSQNDAATFAPVAAGRLVTIENGVDVAKYAHPPLPRAPFRLLYLGRLTQHKRIDRLLALLVALRRLKPDAPWELVVAGPEGDVTVAALEAQAAALGVGEALRVLRAPGAAELAGELAQARFFCCASAYEGFGLAAIEAAACGLIPVLSDIPPFRRLIRRLGAGVLFDPEDAPAGAAAVCGLLDAGPDVVVRLQEAARGYGWERPAAAYVRVYEDVCAGRALAETVW